MGLVFFFSFGSKSVMYFIFLLIGNPKVSIHLSGIGGKRSFCQGEVLRWEKCVLAPIMRIESFSKKDDAALQREVEWKGE